MLASVEQTVQTIAGEQYQLSFKYGSIGDDLSGTATELDLYVLRSANDANPLSYTYTPNPTNVFANLFQDPTLTFIGNGNLWTFWFVDNSSQTSQTQSSPADLVLTNVSLTVPEPASMSLAFVGLAGLAAARRRRRV